MHLANPHRATIKLFHFSMNQKLFKIICEAVSANLDVEVSFYGEQNAQTPFEDDGALHVTKYGLRAVFDVGNGQSLSPAQQNARAASVLDALNLPVTRRTLA